MVPEQYSASAESMKPGAEPALDPDRVPMSRLILEIIVLCGGQSGLVAEVSVNKSFVAVTRGDASPDPGGFALDDLGVNGHRLLRPRPTD